MHREISSGTWTGGRIDCSTPQSPSPRHPDMLPSGCQPFPAASAHVRHHAAKVSLAFRSKPRARPRAKPEAAQRSGDTKSSVIGGPNSADGHFAAGENTHTHPHTPSHTHARSTHARTHARTHAPTYTHTRTHTILTGCVRMYLAPVLGLNLCEAAVEWAYPSSPRRLLSPPRR
jgi:hypothetical protein